MKVTRILRPSRTMFEVEGKEPDGSRVYVTVTLESDEGDFNTRASRALMAALEVTRSCSETCDNACKVRGHERASS